MSEAFFRSAPGPCVLAARVVEIEFGPEVTGDLELIHCIALSKRDVSAVVAPSEGFGIVSRASHILHNDVGLAVGKDAELFEFHITHVHWVIALPESSQQVGSEVVALRRGILTVALFHEWTLATGNTQDSQTDDALGNRQEE